MFTIPSRTIPRPAPPHAFSLKTLPSDPFGAPPSIFLHIPRPAAAPPHFPSSPLPPPPPTLRLPKETAMHFDAHQPVIDDLEARILTIRDSL